MPKTKLFAAIPRKPGIGLQEFHDHWRHPHGTMARHIGTIRRYWQSHQLPCDLLDNRQSRYDGIAEVWLDNVADAMALSAEPVYVRDVQRDELNFIDVSQLKVVVTEEDVLHSGPDRNKPLSRGDYLWFEEERSVNIKLLQFFGESARDIWRSDRDLELGLATGAMRHVCCIASTAVYRESPPAFSGVRELWWPTLTAFRVGIAEDPSAWQALISRHPETISLLVSSERFK